MNASPLFRLRMAAPAAAGLGVLLLCGFLGASGWRAWLGAAFLLMSAPAGALVLVMMMRLIPGAWARAGAPFLEAEASLAPLGALALLPLLAFLPSIYLWTGEHQATAFRAAWLTPAFFVGRNLVWMAAILGLAWAIVRRPQAPRWISCVGLILLTLLDTTACVDWLQSLDPDFNSSGFGLYALCVQVLFALAGALVFAVAGPSPPEKVGVLGGLLLTVLLLWAYFAFMPYLISWSNNTPAAAVWYLRRGKGVWATLAWLVAASRFGPTFLLLFATVRASRPWLLGVSTTVLTGTVAEMAWLALPGPPRGTPAEWSTGALYVAGVASVGWIAAVFLPAAIDWTEAVR